MTAHLTHNVGRHMHVTAPTEPEPVTLRRVTGSGQHHLAAVAAMHRSAAQQALEKAIAEAKAAEFTVAGLCRACGSVEVLLIKADGTRDMTWCGESAQYPTGYGCEVCS